MQDEHGPKIQSLKAKDQGVVAGAQFDDVAARRRIAAELVERMRNAGYKCGILVEQDLHSIAGKSFDPERLFILNVVFECVCADLGVSPRARHSREIIARKVIELADGLRDSETIRTAVIASLAVKAQRRAPLISLTAAAASSSRNSLCRPG